MIDRHWSQPLRSGVLGAALLTSVLACGQDATGPSTSNVTNVRVINALFQSDGSTSTHVPIDYLIDSSMTSPSFFAIVASGVSVSDSANGYVALPGGVHRLVARRAGDTSLTASVYTTSSDLPYVPTLSFPSSVYTTIIVAGIVPATGTIPNNTVPYKSLIDDPFPGPEVNHVIQARFRLINAAPYTAASGNGTTVTMYVTPGDTVPANPTVYTPLGTASYRAASGYVNVDPGPYMITLRVGSTTVLQQVVTFGAGDVRTLVLQSTAAGAPSTANHTLINWLDHHYAP